MYKLLIVEDEEIIRHGIIRSIPWDDLGYEIIGQVTNGKEAIDFVEANCPDVILTDVRMPVMDGLEMSSQINSRYPEVKIIILSGYSDFEYARDAIRFKAFDYLLKPTDKNKFLQCFVRLKHELDQRKNETEEWSQRQAVIYKNFQQLRDAFLIDLLEAHVPVVSMEDSLFNLEIDLSGPEFAVGIIRLAFDRDLSGSTRDEQALIKESCRNVLDEVLQNGKFGLSVIKKGQENIIIFNFKDQPYTEALARKLLDQSMAKLAESLGNVGLNITAGLGLAYPAIYYLAQSYQQAQACFELHFFGQQPKIITCSENGQMISQAEQQWINVIPKSSSKLIDTIINGQPVAIAQILDDIFAKFESQQVRPELIRQYCIFLCNLLQTSIASLGREKISKATSRDCKAEIEPISVMHALKSYITSYFMTVNRLIHEHTNDSGNRELVNSIKAYISENYRDDISLDKLSQLYFISPSYLSYLFKLITGDSYSDYLKMTRLNNAKQLLESHPEMKVYEICFEVGYKEYKYFSIQFKNAFGFSPTSIKKEKRNKL